MDTHQLFGQSLAANHTRHHHFWDGKDMAISSMWCLWVFVQMSDCSVLLQSQVDTFHTLHYLILITDAICQMHRLHRRKGTIISAGWSDTHHSCLWKSGCSTLNTSPEHSQTLWLAAVAAMWCFRLLASIKGVTWLPRSFPSFCSASVPDSIWCCSDMPLTGTQTGIMAFLEQVSACIFGTGLCFHIWGAEELSANRTFGVPKPSTWPANSLCNIPS